MELSADAAGSCTHSCTPLPRGLLRRLRLPPRDQGADLRRRATRPASGTGGESVYGAPFKLECHGRLRFTHRGLLGMASSGPNTNGSQFFMTLANCEWLDNKHTIFGKVTGNSLYNLPRATTSRSTAPDRPERRRGSSGPSALRPVSRTSCRRNPGGVLSSRRRRSGGSPRRRTTRCSPSARSSTTRRQASTPRTSRRARRTTRSTTRRSRSSTPSTFEQRRAQAAARASRPTAAPKGPAAHLASAAVKAGADSGAEGGKAAAAAAAAAATAEAFEARMREQMQQRLRAAAAGREREPRLAACADAAPPPPTTRAADGARVHAGDDAADAPSASAAALLGRARTPTTRCAARWRY